ncbi:MAG: WD40 repeat domain-containing protein [Chloroflexota bacterium]
MKTSFKRWRIVLILTVLLLTTSTGYSTAVEASSHRQVIDTPQIFTSGAWSPNGQSVALSTVDGTIFVQSAITGQITNTLVQQSGPTFSVAWNPDGTKLATGGIDMKIRVWDTTTSQLLNTLSGHTDFVSAVIWSPEGSKIISGSSQDSQNFRIWDAATGKQLKGDNTGSIDRMAWSPDGTKLARVNIVGVDFVDVNTLDALSDFVLNHPEGPSSGYDVAAIAWGPDSKRLATGSGNGTVRIWDLDTKKIIVDHLHANEGQNVDPELDVVNALTFSADGSKLSSLSVDGTIRVWDTSTGKILNTMQVKDVTTTYGSVWSQYGGRLALADNTPNSAGTKAISANTIRIVVPFPSAEDLHATVKQCATVAVKSNLTTLLNSKQLQQFVTAVKALTSDQIPPACAADLIAVAEALQKAP